jgi:septum formation topological specificity factor MinE
MAGQLVRRRRNSATATSERLQLIVPES